MLKAATITSDVKDERVLQNDASLPVTINAICQCLRLTLPSLSATYGVTHFLWCSMSCESGNTRQLTSPNYVNQKTKILWSLSTVVHEELINKFVDEHHNYWALLRSWSVSSSLAWYTVPSPSYNADTSFATAVHLFTFAWVIWLRSGHTTRPRLDYSYFILFRSILFILHTVICRGK
jgi:hypothetical protein